MSDLDSAKQILHGDPEVSCVLCKGDTVYKSEKRGIVPMMEYLDAGLDLHGFSAADRIVGRAAAMLFVLGGVREVYAEVMGEGALAVLKQHGILATYAKLTPYIINRSGEGPCPMEQAVCLIDDPAAAREAIRLTLQQLKNRKGDENTHEKQ